MEVAVTIGECVLLVILSYTYYMVTTGKSIPSILKWGITLSAIGVFAFDKIKLFLFVLSVGVIWLIKHYKKNKRNEFT